MHDVSALSLCAKLGIPGAMINNKEIFRKVKCMPFGEKYDWNKQVCVKICDN